MNTRWENWQAYLGEVTAEYEAERHWARRRKMRLKSQLCIRFEPRDRFYAKVTDWANMDVIEPRTFGSLDEVLQYVSDVDCEKFTDQEWEEFQSVI